MNVSILLLPALLALSAAPAYAQCGGGHSSHTRGSSGHGGQVQGHAGHQDSGPKVKATNRICPVMGQEVKPGRDREVVIRGHQYLVCCDGCGPEMAEHFDKYFDKDGVPLNDPARDSKADPKQDAGKPAPAQPSPERHQH